MLKSSILRPSWILAAALSALPVLSPGAAGAQVTASQKAAAEALFDEGVRLLRAGSFEAACNKLETSQQIDPGVGTLLYLGECYERLGRTASAWASFREAASLAESSNQLERKKIADGRAARLEGELAWLRIEIAPETRALPGLEIRRASALVPVELSGNESPVDPGEVLVQASAPGHEPFSAKITVVPKGRAVVTIPWLRELPQSVAPVSNAEPAGQRFPITPVPESAETPPKPTRVSRSKLPWVLDGVGVVGIGVGAYFGVRAINKADEARDLCSLPGGICRNENGPKARDSAETSAVISTVAFGVGGAALVTGIILHFVLPPKTEEKAVGVTPILDRSNVGLSLTGRL